MKIESKMPNFKQELCEIRVRNFNKRVIELLKDPDFLRILEELDKKEELNNPITRAIEGFFQSARLNGTLTELFELPDEYAV